MKPIVIRATPYSLGGFVLSGLLALIGVLVWIAFQPQEPSLALRVVLSVVWIGLLVYVADAWSERLVYEAGKLAFDSLLKKRLEIVLHDTDDILVVHEGLNQERGIISARFRDRNGQAIEWPLGPLWNRHDLEPFFLLLNDKPERRNCFNMSVNNLLQSIHAKNKSRQKEAASQIRVCVQVKDAVFAAAELDGSSSGCRYSRDASI